MGFVLGETWRATNDDKYLKAAKQAVAVLAARASVSGRGIEWSATTDIIAGGAGTGLFLLYAADVLHDEGARALAIRAGDRLLELGIRERDGLKWQMNPSFARLMPNFSHGTAGIAYFLATLLQGDARAAVPRRRRGRRAATCRRSRRPKATSASCRTTSPTASIFIT